MKFTIFFLFLATALAWSMLPGWAQVPEKTPKARAAKEIKEAVISDHGSPEDPGATNNSLGLLCQMGGGMMGGRGYCGPGMRTGPRQGTRGASSGADLFAGYCAGCHPGGGNNIMPDLPIRRSAQLNNFEAFRTYVRYPTLPNGALGAMPGFSSGQISDSQMRELYQYLRSRWGS